MDFNFSYARLGYGQDIALYFSLFAIAVACAWVFFYKLGQLGLDLLLRGRQRKFPFQAPLAFFAGAWAFPTITLALGGAGIFGRAPIFALAAGVLIFCKKRGLGILPQAPLRQWIREEKFAALACTAMAALIALIGIHHMSPWFDGGFTIAGGNLARTGSYLTARSDGQPGMVALVATVNLFYEKMSPITAMIGWGPLYAPFLFFGMFFLLRELFGQKRWEFFALAYFALPVAFKAQEIRASVSGFGLILWCLFFLLRHFRTKNQFDFLAALFTLAASWNFGQYASLYCFLLIGIWSVGAVLGGQPERARTLWRLLAWTAALEWFHLLFSFSWVMGPDAPFRKPALPGTLALAGGWGMVRLLPRLPKISLPRAWLVLPYLGGIAAAVWLNPWWDPSYNWYFFVPRVWFGEFNFGSYGLLGWLYLAALLLSFRDALDPKGRPAARLLWISFALSSMTQALSALLTKTGTVEIFGEPAFVWDLWKDTALYWNPAFMVIGFAYLFERLQGWNKKTKTAFTPRRVAAGLVVALLLPLQNLLPWSALAAGAMDLRHLSIAFYKAHLAPHADHPWRAQQAYPLPMYVAFAVMDEYNMGPHRQRTDCASCTVHAYGFLETTAPVIDFLLEQDFKPGQSFVTGDSVTTPEVYLNRQVRYSRGPNTICPIYLAYLDRATAHLKFWKPGMRIRRNRHGMAYTVVNPEQNLIWLRPTPTDDGGLSTIFSVPFDGEWEVYRGGESWSDPARVTVDGSPAEAADEPGSGRMALKAGRIYTIKLMPLPGKGALSKDVPVVVHPRRYWNYEKYVLEDYGLKWLSAYGIMRWTGIPSAEISVEEMSDLLTTRDTATRVAILRKYHIRFVIIDPLVAAIYPQADRILMAEPALIRNLVNGTSVYEYKPGN